MTSFGWKRKSGGSILKANGGTSGWEDSEPESEDESQVNHPSKAAKKEETKFEEIRRLKEEGISHAEREEYWHSISKFDDALQIIRGLPKEGMYSLVRNKRTGYDLKKPNDFVGGSGGYAP